MRKRLYKKNLFTQEELPQVAKNLELSIGELSSQINRLHPAEYAARYILLFWRYRFQSQSIAKHLSLSFDLLPEEAALAEFKKFGFRYLSEAINLSLLNWKAGRYPLQLRKDVPSFEEILEMQIEGKRCVSVITDPALLNKYILGERDPVSFTVHDLMHAHHFFSDPRHLAEQIQFYRRAQRLWKESRFQKAFLENPEFKKQFEYACSDMNSHPAHLEAYLQSICLQAKL